MTRLAEWRTVGIVSKVVTTVCCVSLWITPHCVAGNDVVGLVVQRQRDVDSGGYYGSRRRIIVLKILALLAVGTRDVYFLASCC